jgi:hypothetical protein
MPAGNGGHFVFYRQRRASPTRMRIRADFHSPGLPTSFRAGLPTSFSAALSSDQASDGSFPRVWFPARVRRRNAHSSAVDRNSQWLIMFCLGRRLCWHLLLAFILCGSRRLLLLRTWLRTNGIRRRQRLGHRLRPLRLRPNDELAGLDVVRTLRVRRTLRLLAEQEWREAKQHETWDQARLPTHDKNSAKTKQRGLNRNIAICVPPFQMMARESFAPADRSRRLEPSTLCWLVLPRGVWRGLYGVYRMSASSGPHCGRRAHPHPHYPRCAEAALAPMVLRRRFS